MPLEGVTRYDHILQIRQYGVELRAHVGWEVGKLKWQKGAHKSKQLNMFKKDNQEE
jgi:hypothetical protein